MRAVARAPGSSVTRRCTSRTSYPLALCDWQHHPVLATDARARRPGAAREFRTTRQRARAGLGSAQAAHRVARLIEPDPVAWRDQRRHPGRALPRTGRPVRRGHRRSARSRGAPRCCSDLSVSETPLLLVQSEAAAGMLVLGMPDDRMITLADADRRRRGARATVRRARARRARGAAAGSVDAIRCCANRSPST